MFTGIVQGTATVADIEDLDGLRRLTLRFPEGVLDGVRRGASVAVGGTCLTVTAFDERAARFDLVQETLDLTTLGQLRVGDAVNFERSARMGDEIGGHVLSGHISGVAEVVEVEAEGAHGVRIRVRVPDALTPFVLYKGFVALDGCSLTVGEVDGATFDLHLIPETLSVTTLGSARPGSKMNLEIDAMTQAVVETVRRVLAQRT